MSLLCTRAGHTLQTSLCSLSWAPSIQKQSIPVLLEGRDALVRSQTGSGQCCGLPPLPRGQSWVGAALFGLGEGRPHLLPREPWTCSPVGRKGAIRGDEVRGDEELVRFRCPFSEPISGLCQVPPSVARPAFLTPAAQESFLVILRQVCRGHVLLRFQNSLDLLFRPSCALNGRSAIPPPPSSASA